jgi:hypothetical protein
MNVHSTHVICVLTGAWVIYTDRAMSGTLPTERDITGRRQDQLEAAVKKIGSNVKAVQADVSNAADLVPRITDPRNVA